MKFLLFYVLTIILKTIDIENSSKNQLIKLIDCARLMQHMCEEFNTQLQQHFAS